MRHRASLFFSLIFLIIIISVWIVNVYKSENLYTFLSKWEHVLPGQPYPKQYRQACVYSANYPGNSIGDVVYVWCDLGDVKFNSDLKQVTSFYTTMRYVGMGDLYTTFGPPDIVKHTSVSVSAYWKTVGIYAYQNKRTKFQTNTGYILIQGSVLEWLKIAKAAPISISLQPTG